MLGPVLLIAALSFSWFYFLKWQQRQYNEAEIYQVYTKAVGRELPEEALFLDDEDMLAFGGVKTAKGRRFPVGHFFIYDWYLKPALRLEPRLGPVVHQASQKDWWSFHDLIRAAYEEGLLIATTNRQLIQPYLKDAEQVGLVFLLQKGRGANFSQRSAEAGHRLCADLMRVKKNAGPQSSPFILRVYPKIQGALMAWASYWRLQKQPKKAQQVWDLAQQVRPGVDPRVWWESCTGLLEGD